MIGANLRIRLGAVCSALPIATCFVASSVATGGCAMGAPAHRQDDASVDGHVVGPDARAVDAPELVTIDASPDAPGCAISEGFTPALDGVDDLAAYPTSQRLTPGAMLGNDGAALSWDPDKLYVTVTSNAFTGAYEPLHIHVLGSAGRWLLRARDVLGPRRYKLVTALR